jgi:hypothetical protein
MTNDNKNKFAFPVGYHDFHKDPAFNFQLNRWYTMGYARFEDMQAAGQICKQPVKRLILLKNGKWKC